MTDSHIAEIRNYLLDKKLPLDILLEVQDHFISQIDDLQREENLTFGQAFEKTKNSWQKELKPYWDGGWDLLDKNNMVRRFERNLMKSAFKKSLKFTLLTVLSLLIAALFFEVGFYQYFFLTVVSAVIFLPIIRLIQYFKTLNLFRKYSNYVLTLYQSFSFINLSYAYFLYLTLINYDKGALSFYHLPSGKLEWIDFRTVGLYLLAFTVSFFALISQKEYLQRIEKVKPILQYLKPGN